MAVLSSFWTAGGSVAREQGDGSALGAVQSLGRDADSGPERTGTGATAGAMP